MPPSGGPSPLGEIRDYFQSLPEEEQWAAYVVGVLGTYAVRLVRRGRALSGRVPDAHRRWLEAPGSEGSDDGRIPGA